jgi:prepilin-type N-terminal cleavage/methylation domain-containing protein
MLDHAARATARRSSHSSKAFTLIESMIAMALMALFLIGFLVTFIGSRRVTENSVMHAAATSIVYGLIEQIKQLDYTTELPSGVVDPDDPDPSLPNTNTLRLRLNQSTSKWLRAVYTPGGSSAPTVTPAANATVSGAIDNDLGAIPLSTVSGVHAQSIQLNLWVWIDEIPDTANDVTEVKKITVIYTYTYRDGSAARTVRNREVFLRTRYDQ